MHQYQAIEMHYHTHKLNCPGYSFAHTLRVSISDTAHWYTAPTLCMEFLQGTGHYYSCRSRQYIRCWNSHSVEEHINLALYSLS